MNIRHAKNSANFSSIDDIISFYTHHLQLSESKKKESDRENNKSEHSSQNMNAHNEI